MQTPKQTSGSLPIVGHLFEYVRKQDKLLQRGAKEHGDIFALNLMGQNVAVLTGAEAKKVFFKETDKTLNMEEAYEFLAAIFGKVAFLADHETYMNHRPILHALFSRERMKGYLTVMVDVVSEWLGGLEESGTMEISAEMVSLVKEIAGRSFLGKEIHEQLGEPFWQAYDDLSKALDPVLPPHLPLPKFIRRNRAKQYVSSVLYPIVRERRANPKDDPFQMLVEVRMKDGELPSEEIIVQLLMALLFAGHETTAGQAAWTIIQILQHPRYLNLLRDEVDRIFADEHRFDHTTLRALNLVSLAVDETSRMRPSAETIMRTTEADLPIGDIVIPEGWMVQTATAVDHFDRKIFTNPGQYDPLRFDTDRAEHRHNIHSIISFGGGLHKCAGMNFANTEMAVITALLFHNYDLELLTPKTKIERGLGSSRPSETWIRYQRRGSE